MPVVLADMSDAVYQQKVVARASAVGACVAGTGPGIVITPGRKVSKRTKFRPFRGKALIDCVADGAAQGRIRSIDRRQFCR